jgi:hypothetical protein
LDIQIPQCRYDSFKFSRNHNTNQYFVHGINYIDSSCSSLIINGVQQTKYRFMAVFDNNGAFLWKKEGNNIGGNGYLVKLNLTI